MAEAQQPEEAPVTLRVASPADAATVAALARELLAYWHSPSPLSVAEMTARYARALAAPAEPRLQALLAESPDSEGCRQGVGLAMFGHLYAFETGRPKLWLQEIFVRGGWRGRGIGGRLMAGLIDLAERQGCERLIWYTERHDRYLRRFYERFDARPLPGKIPYILKLSEH